MNDLKDMGFEVTEDDSWKKAEGNTGNIYGYLKGNLPKTPLILSAHMDTVAPVGSVIKPQLVDGIIKSDGTTILSADDKAGITVIMMGLKAVRDKNLDHGDIEVVFTACEEIGLLGSKNLDVSKLKGKIAYVFDSSGDMGVIITKAPGQTSLEFKIHGKPAHAGVEPEKGISAIKVASEAITKMALGRIDEETTANIGVINGGTATNIVPDLVVFKGEARSRNEDKLKAQGNGMIDAVKTTVESYGATFDYNRVEAYSAYTLNGNEEIARKLISAMEKVGIKGELGATGGGSDANIFNGHGIPSVNIAVGYSKPHSNEEEVPVDCIIKLAEIVESLIIE
jgi:tripeptide aminopeptidase